MKNIMNIRKAVTTLANKLNRRIKDLSASFIRAWQMIKAQIFLTSKVAGTHITTGRKLLQGWQDIIHSLYVWSLSEKPITGTTITPWVCMYAST